MLGFLVFENKGKNEKHRMISLICTVIGNIFVMLIFHSNSNHWSVYIGYVLIQLIFWLQGPYCFFTTLCFLCMRGSHFADGAGNECLSCEKDSVHSIGEHASSGKLATERTVNEFHTYLLF